MSKYTPIVLFVYNRPEHTRATIEALQKNKLAKYSPLIVFSDGAGNDDNQKKVKIVRDYLRTIKGFQSIKICESASNKGLARSIIEGVTKIVNQYGRVIVLEDDLVTSPFFLKYMNEALEFYKDCADVISIHGYIYPIKDLPETFFLKGADCWGWATWKRGWDLFEKDGRKLLKKIVSKKLAYSFNFGGSYPFLEMLENQIAGKNNSWAIRWYASAFLADKLTLYPGKSLVNNIGHDNSGMHCTRTRDFTVNIKNSKISIMDIAVEENKIVRKKIEKYFSGLRKNNNFRQFVVFLLKKVINKFYFRSCNAE